MALHLRRWGLGFAFLGAVFLTSPLACSADNGVALEQPVSLSSVEDNAFQVLQSADVVYLGEQHDSAADHAAQLEIIEGLYAEDPDMAIALEMFQRPFQPAIDRYLAGEISEAELIEQTQYLERWGFPWEFYAPFLRFAQENGLPVLALNAPSEITRQIAREGLASLEGDDFRYIPPLSEIDTSNTDYQEFVSAAFGSHGSHGNFNFDNFFAAQVTWDETMAMTIADFRTDNPDTQVVVLAGNGHVIYGYGIPDRVERRLGEDLTQQTVLLNPIEEFEDMGGAIADVFWYSE
ncbi:ChaN family lipoprotein [Oscillatoria sp. CS-180]|uniref:ChaN family lipoprotein n=1 Tax=Oscillatoria sp. CS-180 TaxID=3021720 RepID=UPI00232E6048|nr:ChaN family lipoprotein [Oscillatoria sp. CS-180]MDB9527297.1 ChaN family lipoprotein [Oscillatoria sp. CS-180]